MADLDPQAQLYNYIWALLEAQASFTNVFAVGARIKLTGLTTDEQPYSDRGRIDGDFPNCLIEPVSLDPNMWSTSDKNRKTVNFLITVATSHETTGQENIGIFDLVSIILEILKGMQAGAVGLTPAVVDVSWHVIESAIGLIDYGRGGEESGFTGGWFATIPVSFEYWVVRA